MVKKSNKRKIAALSAELAACRIRPVVRNRTRRVRARTARAGGARAIDPFVACVLGPLATSGDGQGAPDGSIDPSVVIEHRQTVVVTPTVSDLLVALVASPYGAVAIGTGNADVSVSLVDAVPNPAMYTAVTPTTVSNTFSTANASFNYTIIPFTEALRTSGAIGDAPDGGFVATHYRVITTQCRASYTGSTFADNGAAATCRVSYGIDEDVANPMTTTGTTASNWILRGVRLPSSPPTSFSAVASMSGSRVFPVRESVNLINAPTNLDYQEIRSSWCPFTQTAESLTANGVTNLWFSGINKNATTLEPDPIPGLGYAPVTFYAASGMASNSSITFEVRTCVEYRLQFNSPSARFARIPPIERPLAIQAVKNIARTLPSSQTATPETEKTGWLGNALSWYGNAMKTAIGTSWSLAGNILSAAGGPITKGIGQGITRTGQSLSGGSRLAIM